MLTGLPDHTLPYASCRSPFSFDEGACRIVTVYKDGGEQRLAAVMADFMAHMVVPDDQDDALITYIPATRAALRRRGFDHGQLLAHYVARALNRRVITLLDHPAHKDQRVLSRSRRFENMGGTFTLTPEAMQRGLIPKSILLIDDVCTTGATLAAASAALAAGGVRRIDCLTFARVY
ncbi:MAG: phosphoribosyltransferase family protein [Raoultibacter sp.]